MIRISRRRGRRGRTELGMWLRGGMEHDCGVDAGVWSRRWHRDFYGLRVVISIAFQIWELDILCGRWPGCCIATGGCLGLSFGGVSVLIMEMLRQKFWSASELDFGVWDDLLGRGKEIATPPVELRYWSAITSNLTWMISSVLFYRSCTCIECGLI